MVMRSPASVTITPSPMDWSVRAKAGGRVGGFLTADCRSPESWETPMTAFFPNIFGEASEKMMVRFSPPEL